MNIGDFGAQDETISITLTNAIWQPDLETEIENYIKSTSSGNIDVTVSRITDKTFKNSILF